MWTLVPPPDPPPDTDPPVSGWTPIVRIVNGVMDLGGVKVTGVIDGTAATDVATVGQIEARTPKITVSATPPVSPDTNDLWVIT